MEHFTWNTLFETGLTEVDNQHRGLVDLTNRFGELLLQPHDVAAEAIQQVLGKLAHYAQQHFAQEEQLMDRFALDPRHTRVHSQEHADFLRQVQRQAAELQRFSSAAAARLHEFLVSWLAFHILGTDQVMARQIKVIRSGSPAGEAFSGVVSTRDPATATLVRAMECLFRQVSDRNRELHDLNESLEARVAQRTQELSEVNRRLEALASTDALTGLANRRTAMNRLRVEWSSPLDEARPLSCIMIDADGFKTVNDAHGHAAGDLVLRRLARCLNESIRTDDTLCRLGGDEFLVICSHTPLSGALQLAAEVLLRVNHLQVGVGTGVWQGRISCGVAVRSAEMADPNDLLKAADQGLYQAKHRGRNRVETVCLAACPVA